jgi:hypothetical protein
MTASGHLVPAATAARVAAQMRRERADLEQVVADLNDTLLRHGADEPPETVVVRGVGGMLHDFYTGLEKLFQAVSPDLNGRLPEGDRWHRDLLHSMSLDLPGIRPPLLSEPMEQELLPYLKFRHLHRNLYGFRLDWLRVLALARGVESVWMRFAAELERFLDYLDALARATAEL